MIFNKEFDKTLWLILNGDNKNKKLIFDFIESIPAPLYQQMLDAFVKYREVLELNNIYILDREDIKGEFLVNNNCKYYFVLDMILNCLIVGKMILVSGEFKKIFEITMYSDASYNNVEEFGNQYLGSIDQFFLDIKLNYELINTCLGKIVVTKENNCLPMYKKVNVDTMPNDMTVNELYQKRKVKKNNIYKV